MNRGSAAVIVIVSILGMALVVFFIFVFIHAEKESERIYDDMVKEAQRDDEEVVYGFGAAPEPGLIKESEIEEEEEGRQKPVIFVFPDKE